MLTAAQLDELTDDQWDAELILQYLEWKAKGGGLLDLGPPGSAKADGSLAAANEAAWPIVEASPRFKALGLSVLDARMSAEAVPPRRAGGTVPAVSRAYVEAQHPRGPGGRWVELFHGTTLGKAQDAKANGLTSKGYGRESGYEHPTLTTDRASAERYAHDAAEYTSPPGQPPRDRPAVVTVRVPADQAAEYLESPAAPVTGLRKPLPASMTHAVDEVRPGGRWVDLGMGDDMDALLKSEFRPQDLEARRVKHPRSGYMVEAGHARSVLQPASTEHGNESLGTEGPPLFKVTDYGDPTQPGHNSLLYPKDAGTEPIADVYRGMTQAEWEQAQQRGYIESDRRGAISDLEGTNAAADPRDAVSYLPTGKGVLAKISVRPEDKWFTISADPYLRTRRRIPLDRVSHAVEFERGGKYDNEFRARPVRAGAPPQPAARAEIDYPTALAIARAVIEVARGAVDGASLGEAARGADAVAAELARLGHWDPRKHPRIGHGEHGGQFAKVPHDELPMGSTGRKPVTHLGAAAVAAESFRDLLKPGERLLTPQEIVDRAPPKEGETPEQYQDRLEHEPPPGIITREPVTHRGKPDDWTMSELAKLAQAAKPDDPEYQALRQANEAYAKGGYRRAIDNLNTAAREILARPAPGPLEHSADALRAEDVRTFAAMVESQHEAGPAGDWLPKMADEIDLERDLTHGVAGRATDDAAVIGDTLGSAARDMRAARYDDAIAKLRAAASYRTHQEDYKGEARLTMMAARLEKDYGSSARLEKATQAYVAKGSDAVPDLFGGGQEMWDGQVELKPDLGTGYFGLPTAADMSWDGHMRMTTDTAQHIQDKVKGGGEISDTGWLDIPLHELIHGLHDGKRMEQEQGRLASGRTQRDDAILDAFHRLDLAGPSGTGTPLGHHLDDIQQTLGREKLPQSMAMEGTGATQADIDSLVKRGFLEWTGTSSSTYGPDGKVTEHGRSWKRTAKAVQTDPQGIEPYDLDMRAYADSAGAQAIEEGFTELGTVQHAPGWFTKVGVGGRRTPLIAPAAGWKGNVPGPAVKRRVTGKLTELSAQTGDGWVKESLAAWKKGDVSLAQFKLSEGRNRALGKDWVTEADQILDVMARRPKENPQWERKRAALQQRLSLEATKISGRMTDVQTGLGMAGMDLTSGQRQTLDDMAQLQRLEQAMARAANDLEYGDTDGALEELGQLQHSGDAALADDAVSLGDDLQALIETPYSKRLTLAEYARRRDDRDKILAGDAGNAYPEWTKQAYLWCELVAQAEGKKGAALRRRVHELADEVNREGPGHKIDVMTDQVLRLPHSDVWGRPGMLAHIRDTFRSEGAQSAFEGAYVRAVPPSDPYHETLIKKYRGW